MTAFGEKGDSGKIHLTSGKNNFERGARDEFGFEAVDLGELKSIHIGHDGMNIPPSFLPFFLPSSAYI